MQSDLADLVISSNQCLDNLKWLKKVGIAQAFVRTNTLELAHPYKVL